MSFNSNSRQLIAKTETTAGEYLQPNYASDFDVNIYNLEDVSDDYGHTGGSPIADGTGLNGKSYATLKTRSISFNTDLNSGSDPLVAPKWWKFLDNCGFTVVEDGATPATASWDGVPNCKTMSMDLPKWECNGTGEADLIAGAVGTFELSWDSAGAVLQPKFTFTGKMGGVRGLLATDRHKPSGIDTGDCNSYLGATATMGGEVYRCWGGTLTQAAGVEMIEDSNDVTNTVETGIDHYVHRGADPKLSMIVQRIPASEYDMRADIIDNNVHDDIVIDLSGYKISCSSAQPIDGQVGNKNNTDSFELKLKISSIELKLK